MLPDEALGRHSARSALLCYVEGEPWPEAIQRVESWCAGLVLARNWAVAPPEFVYRSADGDHTLGVVLWLLPSADAEGRGNPPAVEQELLGDVCALVESARVLSREGLLELAFELDGRVVGWIENGDPDTLLREGLIEPWRARC